MLGIWFNREITARIGICSAHCIDINAHVALTINQHALLNGGTDNINLTFYIGDHTKTVL